MVSNIFYFHPYLGMMNPFWLIFFKWVETTNLIRTVPSTFYCSPGRKSLGEPATHWSARLKPFQRCEFPGLSFPPPKGCGRGASQRCLEFYAPKPWGCMIQFKHVFFNGLVVPPTRKKTQTCLIATIHLGYPEYILHANCTWPTSYQ